MWPYWEKDVFWIKIHTSSCYQKYWKSSFHWYLKCTNSYDYVSIVFLLIVCMWCEILLFQYKIYQLLVMEYHHYDAIHTTVLLSLSCLFVLYEIIVKNCISKVSCQFVLVSHTQYMLSFLNQTFEFEVMLSLKWLIFQMKGIREQILSVLKDQCAGLFLFHINSAIPEKVLKLWLLSKIVSSLLYMKLDNPIIWIFC